MEVRVKERLIGAGILVAVIVALVPELLSGSRQSETPAELPAVATPGTVRTYTIDLSAPDIDEPPAETPAEPPAPANLPATPMPELQPPTRPAAESAPSVSKPMPAQTQPTKPEISGWAVQLGSFSSRDNAERLAKELNAKGYKAFISRQGAGAKLRHRVRVGPEQEKSRAQNLAERLKREGRQVSVVPHP